MHAWVSETTNLSDTLASQQDQKHGTTQASLPPHPSPPSAFPSPFQLQLLWFFPPGFHEKPSWKLLKTTCTSSQSQVHIINAYQCCKSMQIQCCWRLFLPFLSFLGFDLSPFLEEQITSAALHLSMTAEKRPKTQWLRINQQSWSPALPSPFSFQLQSFLWFFPPSTSCRTATLENQSKYLCVYIHIYDCIWLYIRI